MTQDLLFDRPAPASAELVLGDDGGGQQAGPTDLLFEWAAPASANLLFGGDGSTPPQEAYTATLAATFPSLVATGFIAVGETATLVASFPPLVATFTATAVIVETATLVAAFAPLVAAAAVVYSSNTARPTVGQSASAWQGAAMATGGVAHPQQGTRSAPEGWAAFWQRAIGAPGGVENVRPGLLAPHRGDAGQRYQEAAPAHAGAMFPHQDAVRAGLQIGGSFKGGATSRTGAAFPHQDGDRTKRASLAAPFQNGTGIIIARGTDFQVAVPMPLWWWAAHQEGIPPPPGLSVYTRPPEPPPVPCYTPDPALVFSWPAAFSAPALLFQCGDYDPDQYPVTIPIQRVYIVLNTATLRRVSDNAVVPAFRLSLSLDVGSWTWGFSASIPGSARGLVEATTGGPVELAAMVNGAEIRVLAENITRERVFGDSRLAVTGRGKNAILDAPYSPIGGFANNIDRTAQQLMEDALTVNNVSIGWGVDFGLTDWLVPAGAWSHRGTYISALSRIAAAAGGYLQPHRTADTLKVRHLYPTAPWDWAGVTPDFILPSAVVTRESIRWASKPAYNRVYVSGEGQGVRGRVTRQGTAGDLLAPMVVDPLITHADAARQRGLSLLGDTGEQLAVGLRLPVLAETGIIEPGAFVQYTDGGDTHRGIVRATNVEVGLPEVWQSLEIEVHA